MRSRKKRRWTVGLEDPLPPEGFVRKLEALDRNLRIRWSRTDQAWHIEERVGPAACVDPSKYFGPKRHDRFVRARDGYEYLRKVMPDVALDERVLYFVVAGDLHRYGGAHALCDAIEREEARDEAERKRKRRSDSRDRAKDVFENMTWRSGRRVGLALRPQAPRPSSKAPRFFKVYREAQKGRAQTEGP